MTTPLTLGEIRARYLEIAPDPDPLSSGVAWDVERSLVVTAIRHLITAASPAEWEAARAVAAAAYLMEWLRQARPDVATVKARTIAAAWRDGGDPMDLVRDLARVTGVDVGEVTRLARAETAISAGLPPVPVDAPKCRRCGTGDVAVPQAGAFGYFCEDCIALCQAGQDDENHVCAVCAAAEAEAWR